MDIILCSSQFREDSELCRCMIKKAIERNKKNISIKKPKTEVNLNLSSRDRRGASL